MSALLDAEILAETAPLLVTRQANAIKADIEGKSDGTVTIRDLAAAKKMT